MLTLVALVLLAGDGGSPLPPSPPEPGRPAVTIAYECTEAVNPAVQVDGGWYLPTDRFDRTECRLAACEKRLKDRAVVATWPPPSWVVWTVGLAAALVAGLALGLKMGGGGP